MIATSKTDTGLLGTIEECAAEHVLRFERRLAHPVERVWTALTEPDELRTWLADADIDLVDGGRVTLHWLNYETTMHATVTALDPPHDAYAARA